jgi:hypothetical protein
VPVYISNEDYGAGGPVAADERKAYERIYHEALQEKRPAGSVCVYLVGPDGAGFASLIVSDAAKPGQLQKLLDEAIARFKVPKGKPLVTPTPQAPPPKVAAETLVLHLVSRYEHRGSWAEFPAENYIVLKPAAWGKLLPAGEAQAGATYDIDRTVAAQVLTYFFPQTEMCDVGQMLKEDGPYKHRIEQVTLKGRVIALEHGTLRVRLEGSVKLRHKFYPNHEDNNHADAQVIGFLEGDAGKKKPPKLRLVTSQAAYGTEKWGKFEVAVCSVR